MRRWALALFCFSTAAASAQDPKAAPGSDSDETRFKISAEIKAHYRWSEDDKLPLRFPFPPDHFPEGQTQIFEQTVAPGSSIEVSNVIVDLDLELPHAITGHAKIHFIDLYNRNPTSTDQTVNAKEAWMRFGSKYESLEPSPSSSVYALFGKAPKFEREHFRKLESYGLVSTAFNRFEDLQLQIGGNIGRHFYFRTQVSNGNPTFFRDPNALAGDNGTPDRQPPNPDPQLGSGFVIFYHAEVEEFEVDDRPEVGAGVGLRFLTESFQSGVDVLGFYYRTRLSPRARLRGTFYEGDLDILDGTGGISLPISGDDRTEYGANVDTQVGNLGVFFQWVHEEAASLPRTGVEVEAGYKFVRGDQADPKALFTSIEPVVRYSKLVNDFTAPGSFVAPSVMWDWAKLDLGARITIRKGLDVTVEYAFHDITAARPIHHDEFLTTLRLRF